METWKSKVALRHPDGFCCFFQAQRQPEMTRHSSRPHLARHVVTRDRRLTLARCQGRKSRPRRNTDPPGISREMRKARGLIRLPRPSTPPWRAPRRTAAYTLTAYTLEAYPLRTYPLTAYPLAAPPAAVPLP